MPKISAGILLYRRTHEGLQVFLVHPGGPLWKNKDDGFWGIPKGEAKPDEDLFAAALREFAEEVGFQPAGPFTPLTPTQLRSGKIIHAWACAGDCDPERTRCNTFTMEWPPKSGRQQSFPEVDRAGWFTVADARRKLSESQMRLVDELLGKLG
jgi:predicted NUDIX family NTP pyrophosphohydrolase